VIRPGIGEPPKAFTDSATVSLSSSWTNGIIRYTLNGRKPGVKDTIYTKPITITKTTRIRALFFDQTGSARGQEWSMSFEKIPYEVNLATGKPVSDSMKGGETDKLVPENANDGWVILEKFWGAHPWPQWWQVDLEKTHDLNKVQLFFYWDGKRYYQYTVDVSADAKKWTNVADRSSNTDIATSEGVVHEFAPVSARYIRVNMLKNSANQGVHIVEFRAYAAE